MEQIRDIYKQSRQTYGCLRIYAELNQLGVICIENRIAHLMRLNRLVITALQMALWARKPSEERLHHSDRGHHGMVANMPVKIIGIYFRMAV
jgi:transposase InsO family protein